MAVNREAIRTREDDRNEGRPATGPARLRLLCLNAWALPFGLAPRARDRLHAIGRHLRRLEPDVAAFQECWTAESRRVLLEAGALAGLRHAWHRRRLFGGSGLLLLSREPLERVAFARFRVRGPPERPDQGDFLGGKGFALARPGGHLRGLTLALTHLQAAYGGDAHLAHRTAQAAELALSLAAIPGPVVLAGDLNAEPGTLPLALLRGLGSAMGEAEEAGRPEPTTQAPLPGSPRPARRIDYVLFRGDAGAALRVTGFRRVLTDPEPLSGGGHLRPSDHAGLLAELELLPGTRDPAAPGPAAPLAEAAEVLLAGARHAGSRRRAATAVTGLAAALTTASLPGARRRASRRTLLRGLLAAVAGAGAGATLLGAGAGAEIAAEEEAFLDLAARLAALAGPAPDSGIPPRHPGRCASRPSAPGSAGR